MKKIIGLVAFAAFCLLLGSCGSGKNIAYFQNADSVIYKASRGLYDARIMPKDLLTITVSTTDPKASMPFNLSVTNTLNSSGTLYTGAGALQTYLVDNDGYINFPVVGKIRVGGLTKRQCEDLIKENILLGKQDATDDEIHNALKMAYLDEFVATLKDGLNTQIGERGMLLSGGQKQRVAIARAFIKNAPIVILDEATSALDNKSEAIVQKAIDNLMIDKTVFVIAHRLSTVKNANRIAVINEGVLAELGSHDELMQIENGTYKNLYNMQFRTQNEHQQKTLAAV